MTQPKTAAQLRAEAQAEVKELDLDCLVRMASKLGTFDGTANWEFRAALPDGSIVRVCSTYGAGTNSASVIFWAHNQSGAGTLVYASDGHGSQLVTFRKGQRWISAIRGFADERTRLEEAEKKEQQRAIEAKEVLKFTPLPD